MTYDYSPRAVPLSPLTGAGLAALLNQATRDLDAATRRLMLAGFQDDSDAWRTCEDQADKAREILWAIADRIRGDVQ